ncbi:hypothetical protein IWQ49_000443 [Labrenzia sp. EL_126]|nr:hypothetical protein [Labrenzia sp. EL_126]
MDRIEPILSVVFSVRSDYLTVLKAYKIQGLMFLQIVCHRSAEGFQEHIVPVVDIFPEMR